MELTSVVAKMSCSGITTHRFGQFAGQATIKVHLGAVYSNVPGDNKDFADATPSGECWMQISDGRPAAEFFKPGKKYYVTFAEAPD